MPAGDCALMSHYAVTTMSNLLSIIETIQQGSLLCWHSSLKSFSAFMIAHNTHHTVMMLRGWCMS